MDLSSAANTYIGRFAPSPSGPLHMGSLVCALASWLDAKKNHGSWLLRIEDLDPPREQPGADRLIIECLHAHQLHWDGEIVYQSQRHQRYRDTLEDLTERRLCYRCSCTRARLKSLNGIYDRFCWENPPDDSSLCAVRLHLDNALNLLGLSNLGIDVFDDAISGLQQLKLSSLDDFVVHRKDGLFAYQLAVCVDDRDQGISHVVRGADLITMTHAQRILFRLLNATPPKYAHIALVTDEKGNKLSKQNHAPAVDNTTPQRNLLRACKFLGLPVDTSTKQLDCTQLLVWATEHWQCNHSPLRHTKL